VRESIEIVRGITEPFELSSSLIEAVKLLELAAKQGHAQALKELPDAQYDLGVALWTGQKLPQNKKLAFELVTSASKINLNARRMLADIYWLGEGEDVPQNRVEAVALYSSLGDNTDSDVQLKLADAYWEGLSVEKNIKKAIEFYQLASKSHPRANLRLAEAYSKGLEVAQDIKSAIQHYVKVLMSRERESCEKAVKELTLMANGGCVDAQYALAMAYKKAIGVERNDKECVNWLIQAEKQGHLLAQTHLGLYKLKGEAGLDRDVGEGIRLLTQAATKNDPFAPSELANFYWFNRYKGRGKFAFEALRWAIKGGKDNDNKIIGECLAYNREAPVSPVVELSQFGMGQKPLDKLVYHLDAFARFEDCDDKVVAPVLKPILSQLASFSETLADGARALTSMPILGTCYQLKLARAGLMMEYDGSDFCDYRKFNKTDYITLGNDPTAEARNVMGLFSTGTDDLGLQDLTTLPACLASFAQWKQAEILEVTPLFESVQKQALEELPLILPKATSFMNVRNYLTFIENAHAQAKKNLQFKKEGFVLAIPEDKMSEEQQKQFKVLQQAEELLSNQQEHYAFLNGLLATVKEDMMTELGNVGPRNARILKDKDLMPLRKALNVTVPDDL
jgi:TPR repeat protein